MIIVYYHFYTILYLFRLWAGGDTSVDAYNIVDESTPIRATFNATVMRSFVLHETTDNGAPKRICCNFQTPRVVKVICF